jgi:hypothetical protein
VNQPEKVSSQTGRDFNRGLDPAEHLDKTSPLGAVDRMRLLRWPTDQPSIGPLGRGATQARVPGTERASFKRCDSSPRHRVTHRAAASRKASSFQFMPDVGGAEAALCHARRHVVAMTIKQSRAARALRTLRERPCLPA